MARVADAVRAGGGSHSLAAELAQALNPDSGTVPSAAVAEKIIRVSIISLQKPGYYRIMPMLTSAVWRR